MHTIPETEFQFLHRTLEHIHRVQWNMFTLVTEYGDIFKLTSTDRQMLMQSVMRHDASKLSDMQYDAYILVTAFHKQKKRRRPASDAR